LGRKENRRIILRRAVEEAAEKRGKRGSQKKKIKKALWGVFTHCKKENYTQT